MNLETFAKYETAVRSYQGDPQAASLLMAKEDRLSAYYAPFEWVNPEARIVLVGITPGKVQAHNALAEASRALLSGASVIDALRRAKQTAAFSGAMRPNLIALMDHIGLHRWLRIPTCAELFGSAGGLLQTASVLQFPVFLAGENYNGSPDMTKCALLRNMLTEHFGAVAKAVPRAILVPLGPVPQKAIAWLSAQGTVSASRILHGLPHPSGANAERIAYFLGRKSRAELSAKTDSQKLDLAKDQLLRAVAAMHYNG